MSVIWLNCELSSSMIRTAMNKARHITPSRQSGHVGEYDSGCCYLAGGALARQRSTSKTLMMAN